MVKNEIKGKNYTRMVIKIENTAERKYKKDREGPK